MPDVAGSHQIRVGYTWGLSVRLVDMKLFGATKEHDAVSQHRQVLDDGERSRSAEPGRVRYRRFFNRAAQAETLGRRRRAVALGLESELSLNCPRHRSRTSHHAVTTRRTAGTWCAATASGTRDISRASRRYSRCIRSRTATGRAWLDAIGTAGIGCGHRNRRGADECPSSSARGQPRRGGQGPRTETRTRTPLAHVRVYA